MMKCFLLRASKLVWGLFLYALGVVFMLKANIGYAPWEVFHAGLASTVNISFGAASILVGVIIVAIVAVLKEKLGFGTLLNMVLIGVMIDIILWLDILPVSANMFIGVAMLFAGMFIIACGSYYYISSAFGAGPRDSLMVALNRRTGLSVGVCRGLIEFSAAFTGWLLGGMVGIGTVISTVFIGACIEIVFKFFKFDAATVTHETLKESVTSFKNMLAKRDLPLSASDE